jgi:hypothetical protein
MEPRLGSDTPRKPPEPAAQSRQPSAPASLDERRRREAEALRQNLRRRKAQQRARPKPSTP